MFNFIFSNLFTLWLFSFIGGAILGFISLLIYKVANQENPLFLKYEGSNQNETIKDILRLVEKEVTNNKFSIHDAAQKFSINPREINVLMKKYLRCTFDKFLLYSRIEIVKEHLRSSNASEISIAKSCGFSSVNEMEKRFHSIMGSTLQKYREKNIFI